jgi:acyl-CoA thioesterase FadM
MHDALLDDSLNPRFVHYATAASRSGVAAQIDAAISAWQGAIDIDAIADTAIEYLEPISRARPLRIDLWVAHLDDTSCVFGFLVSSEDGYAAFARGERTIIRTKAPWSPSLRGRLASLLKNLPAYA